MVRPEMVPNMGHPRLAIGRAHFNSISQKRVGHPTRRRHVVHRRQVFAFELLHCFDIVKRG
jgi:hypothetical protein